MISRRLIHLPAHVQLLQNRNTAARVPVRTELTPVRKEGTIPVKFTPPRRKEKAVRSTARRRIILHRPEPAQETHILHLPVPEAVVILLALPQVDRAVQPGHQEAVMAAAAAPIAAAAAAVAAVAVARIVPAVEVLGAAGKNS